MAKEKSRKLKYALAINEAFHQAMKKDKNVFLIGQGLKSPWYVGSTANGLIDKFGEERVIDTPIAENAITGAAVGAAIAGMKPIVVHPRVDFMMYAIDPIVNEAANWRYVFNGVSGAGAVFWGIINRGGEQGAQHSQALHAMFAHIPGLKVVMPATAYDAKGLMLASIESPDPVVYMDDRWLYGKEGEVPEEYYTVPIGKADIKRKGTDITIVAISYLVEEALMAAEELAKEGIKAEVIDPRTISPMDYETIIKSAKKTGRLLIVDPGWLTGGIAGDIAAKISETDTIKSLKKPIKRVTIPDCPAPTSRVLEAEYYPRAKDIVKAVKGMMK